GRIKIPCNLERAGVRLVSMKRKRLFHTAAFLATSLAAFAPQANAKEVAVKQGKKRRPTTERLGAHSREAANAGPEPPPERKKRETATDQPAPTVVLKQPAMVKQ